MNTIKLSLLLITTIFLLNCGQTQNSGKKTDDKINTNKQITQMAEQIKITGLQKALEKLKNRQTEFDFIGITSNGVDCIYFVQENDKFNLEFEAMTSEQLPYLNKLKDFAVSNNYKTELTTYNNKPNYKSDSPAPVIRIETNLPLQEMAKFGEKVQSEIFKNNQETIYDIVP